MNTKICGKCKQEKQLSEYGNNITKKDKLQSNCKVCAKLITREYYKNNKKRHQKTVSLKKENYINIRQNIVINYLLEHPCIDCGEADPVVLEFDHIKDVKIKNISAMIRKPFSIENIYKEIEKCVVRCSNCHRKKTAKDFGYFRYKFMEESKNK